MQTVKTACELTFDGDSNAAYCGRRHSIASDTLVQIVRVATHVPNNERLARFFRYTYTGYKHKPHTSSLSGQF